MIHKKVDDGMYIDNGVVKYKRNKLVMSIKEEMVILYYNYCKVNPGLTYEEFINEDAFVINSTLYIQAEIDRKETEDAKKAAKTPNFKLKR